jgi:predicted GIY-YIG superfamily endonuclease
VAPYLWLVIVQLVQSQQGGIEMQEEVVYLIHFDQAYYHARHYLGTTTNLEKRLRQHAGGCGVGGARLMEVIMQVGITWRVARLWAGGRVLERQLKALKNSARLCPICEAERIAEQIFDTVSEAEQEAYIGGLFDGCL